MRPIVLRCRELLASGRGKAKCQHDSGTPGTQVSNLLADLYDDVVLEVWNHAVDEHRGVGDLSEVALIAHGGFGRRDLAPYSDADLMLLADRGGEEIAEQIAGNLTRDLTDAGIPPGLSIRSPGEACSRSWSDAVVFSSLSESRLLAGSLHVYRKFFERFRRGSIRRQRRIIPAIVEARRDERNRWGETNYLLRPNVKRSPGALRDIQMIRWIGFARHGESDLEQLVRLGALPREDHGHLRRAYAFMLRLRHELHFREGKEQDVLDRHIQLEIAERWGYTGDDAMLPVERFMRDYFDNTRNVRYANKFCVDDALSRRWPLRVGEVLASRKLSDDIRMGPTEIWVVGKNLDAFASNLGSVMRLMALANEHQRRISHGTWEAIRRQMLNRGTIVPDDEAINAFLSLLTNGGRLANLLRRLHELRILEQLIPEFKRMRGLLQFNAYHKYTVDAHSILAVEAATKFVDDPGGIGRRYRRIEDKCLLHLTLLIHDIGKGYEEDHCVVGERIARDVAARLRLDENRSETLCWLVRNHLAVNVVAFRHDLSDPQIVLRFAAEVGSIRRLELLVVHTVADLRAVGPGVATDWKLNLIENLYRRTRRYFDSGDLPGSPNDPEVDRNLARINDILRQRGAPEPCRDLLESLPLSLVVRGDPETLASQIIQVEAAMREDDQQTLCTSKFDPSVGAVRYTVIRREDARTIGTFARAARTLSACGLIIQRAQIETAGPFAWDDFWVRGFDPTPHPPDAQRQGRVRDELRATLDDPDRAIPPTRRTWRTDRASRDESVNVLPAKVVFDNETVERYTILSLFAYDEAGLLHRVAGALADQNLVLYFAKIDTHLDQVADVFYVTENDGSRIVASDRQEEIRTALLDVV